MARNISELINRRRPGEARRGLVVDRLAGKTTKQDSNYRPAEHGSKETCFDCDHYLVEGGRVSTCRRVAGIVEASDVCDLFTARQNEPGVPGPENSGTGLQLTINIGGKNE